MLITDQADFRSTLQVSTAGTPNNYRVHSNSSADFDPDVDPSLMIESYQVSDIDLVPVSAIDDNERISAALVDVVADARTPVPDGRCRTVLDEPQIRRTARNGHCEPANHQVYSTAVTSEPSPELMQALLDIEGALADNIRRSTEIRKRVLRFHRDLSSGRSIHDLVKAESEPRTVEMLTENMAILEGVGSKFRLLLARELREEGLTIAAIAALFGVTRQRISALLRQD